MPVIDTTAPVRCPVTSADSIAPEGLAVTVATSPELVVRLTYPTARDRTYNSHGQLGQRFPASGRNGRVHHRT